MLKTLHISELGATVRWHETSGTGPPIIWLPGHGMPALSNFLDVITQPMLRDRAAVLIDAPGSGFSKATTEFDYSLLTQANSVAAVLDALGLKACPIVGYSMGGSVGITLATIRPDLVGQLIVAEANIFPGGGPVSRFVAALPLADFVQTHLPEMLHDLADGNPFEQFVASAWAQADPEGLHGMARALVSVSPDFADQFERLTCPRCFVFGEKSLSVDTGLANIPDPARLASKGISVATIPDVGHDLMLTAPALFAQIVAAALGENA